MDRQRKRFLSKLAIKFGYIGIAFITLAIPTLFIYLYLAIILNGIGVCFVIAMNVILNDVYKEENKC